MPLIALGLNHLTAPVALREQVVFDAFDTGEALRQLAGQKGIDEALILSTCNRTELYCSVASGAEGVPHAWLHRHHHLSLGRLDEFLYRFDEHGAVRHIFRVATGLDSMVLGEPQILGQVKQAYRQARIAGSLKAPLERLMQHSFAVAKRVRTETRIGARTVSVAFTAVHLAEHTFTDLNDACVLLIGAGETMELAARHLAEKSVQRLIVANRTLQSAQELAHRYGGYAIALSDLEQHLCEADIVIVSTASRQPVVTRAMVEAAMAKRRHRPTFMVDMAVPRNIDPSVGGMRDVFLYNIDDLRQVIDENKRSREVAAREAEAIIDMQVDYHMAWRRTLNLRNPARHIRADALAQRQQVLAKAQTMLAHGKSADEALDFLAHTLTNRLLHTPCARLHQAAMSGDIELLRAAEHLYGIQYRDEDA